MKNKLVTRFYPKSEIINLRVTINRERAEISTNCKTDNMVWNKSLQRVNSKNEKACLISSSLNTVLSKKNGRRYKPDATRGY
jgi:hypothetical protein